MPRSPLATRYARALFELAQEQNRLDAVRADLAAIATLGNERDTFRRMISPYAFSQDVRTAIWKELLGGKADELTVRFILFLVSKRRGSVLLEIIRAFEDLCSEEKGIQPIEIVSARPLSSQQLNAITERVEARIQSKVSATQTVDPALLGGLQIRVRDTVYDFSVNHQLDKLYRAMTTAQR
ncbi:MAG: ATP synthase F1 subunit delta [Kiritimatiellae bacterium]|nr:ATP synthase F1 subunit delta [Kiritimatiellia bacterium]